MRKILVFYSKTGSGHLRAAQALKEEIEANPPAGVSIEVVLQEGLGKARMGVKTDPSFAYALFSSKLQGFYNFIYVVTNNKLGVKLLRLFIRGVWGKNLRQIIDSEKPDLIITTHHHISPQTVGRSKHKAPFINIVTDLGYPHIIWFDKNLDKIITPTEVISKYAQALTKGQSNKIVHIDYPLKNHFKTIKKEGFSNTLLVLGGGLGSGNINNFPSKKIVVVCGENKKLFKELDSRLSAGNDNLEVHGYVDHLMELYQEADIILTKAGPGTIVECAVLKKPLIITSWIGMQEKDNVDFVVDNHLGVYVPDPRKLPGAINRVYASYDKYTQGNSLFSDGTKKIVEYILKGYS